MTSAIPFRTAVRFWLKLGFISFGGPAGQIAIMHQELVERRRWISERRFLHALNYCMLLPGPEAQQLATYLGWLMHRTWGGIVAGGLFVLPSLVILTALSWAYVVYGNTAFASAVFFGVKPAVVAIVALAAVRIGRRVLHSWILVIIAGAAFVAIFAFNIAFPWIILVAGVLGFLGGRLAPARFAADSGHDAQPKAHAAAVIDDDTPAPTHARFHWPHTILIAAVGVISWAGVMAVLIAVQSSSGALPQMGEFFTKAAFLTFGGAYAVLPYVYQGAVSQHHWLTPPQMIDGLALGETTPGPLIMVVVFVGYVGSWTHAAEQALTPPLAGLLGGLCATYFTFLPSFLLILLGAPIVEGTRGNLHLSAPLTGITAAVVGVILNLAAFFAYHVFWPRGFDGPIDWLSVIIGLAAAGALLRFKAATVAVVIGSAVAGIAVRLAGSA